MIQSCLLKSSLVVTFLFGIAITSIAQISGGELKSGEDKKANKTEKDKTAQKMVDASSYSGSSFYTTGMLIYGFRDFEDQTTAKVYSDFELQKPTYTYGGNLGIVIPLDKGFSIDASLSVFSIAESYHFEDTLSDSSYSSKNIYIQAAIPIKLRYTFLINNDFHFFCFGGIAPGNIFDLRIKSSYKTKGGAEVENDVVNANTNAYSPFTFSYLGGIGADYYFNALGVTMGVEYRKNLTNTYAQDVLKRSHKLYGFTFNVGVAYRF